MRKLHFISLVAAGTLAATITYGGNDEKRGQAGAGQLLINPWTRSSGTAGALTAGIRGVESMNFNVAGLAHTKGTEFAFSNVRWLSGTDININAVGFGQSVGKGSGVLGISVMTMNTGTFYETTVERPEGTGRTFSPQLFNAGISYARIFSNSISGGILLRVISESVPNITAPGVTFDAGVQYKTGDRDEFKFGVSLRNIGPNIRYQGEGLAFRGNPPGTTLYQGSFSQKSASLPMPSLLNIGLSYDVLSGEEDHYFTVGANFTSNTYTHDQYQAGVEYGFLEYLKLRAGFLYYEKIFAQGEERTDVHGPLTFGMSAQLPFGKEKSSKLSIDYSYRTTYSFGGTHSIGMLLNF
jgi:hypothetical protein